MMLCEINVCYFVQISSTHHICNQQSHLTFRTNHDSQSIFDPIIWKDMDPKNKTPTNPRKTFLTKGREKYKDVEDVIKELGKCCIADKLYRKGNTFYDITKEELEDVLPQQFGVIQGGYMFLDEDPYDNNEYSGMVRLYDSYWCNPRWSFYLER